MAKFLNLIGRPGSGKSTLAREITHRHGGAGGVVTLNEYNFLEEMFRDEENHPQGTRRFRRREQGNVVGFDVLDPRVFPIALSQVNERASQYLQEPDKLVLIEFSRPDYSDVRNCFSTDIMKNAQFCFVKAPLETCIKRIRQRVERNFYPDDKLVSEEVMRQRYQEDGLATLLNSVSSKRVHVLDNTSSWNDAWLEMRTYLDEIMYHHTTSSAVWSMGNLKWTRAPYNSLQWPPLI
ncbi:MAG TPA: AAA family ATPase [Ktedonobacteraceae bacterium]